MDAVTVDVPAARLVADGMGFLEGPVALPDGALLVVDLRFSCVWRIEPNGTRHRIAETPGSLNRRPS